MQYAEIIIGAVCTIVGVLLSYAAFARNSKKDSEASGKESGTVLTEIGYIKGGVDRIERKQDERYNALDAQEGGEPLYDVLVHVFTS